MTDKEKLREFADELSSLIEFTEVGIEIIDGLVFHIGGAKIEIGPEDNVVDTLRDYSEND